MYACWHRKVVRIERKIEMCIRDRDRSCHDSESGSEKCEVISGGFLWTQLLCAYRSADEIG